MEGHGSREGLAEQAVELDHAPLVPTGFDFVREAEPVADQALLPLGIGRGPTRRILRNQPKLLTKRETIARQTPAALRFDLRVDRAFENYVGRQFVGVEFKAEGSENLVFELQPALLSSSSVV